MKKRRTKTAALLTGFVMRRSRKLLQKPLACFVGRDETGEGE